MVDVENDDDEERGMNEGVNCKILANIVQSFIFYIALAKDPLRQCEILKPNSFVGPERIRRIFSGGICEQTDKQTKCDCPDGPSRP